MNEIAESARITPLIVYRHFDSKDDLYRAVLERASGLLGDELAAGSGPKGLGVDAASVLAAARRDPAGFRLLWRHAAREPEFAAYADDLRDRVLGVVRAALAPRVAPSSIEWAAHATFGYLIESVLTWLEFGDPTHDDQYVAATNAAMRAGVRAWSGVKRRPA